MPSTDRKLVRMQEKGQVTLPAAVRRKLGLKKGDLVAIEETAGGILITPQTTVAKASLGRIDGLLRERGISFDELIYAERRVRMALLKEAYGLPSDASDEAVQKRTKSGFFAAIDSIHARNQDKDPEEIERLVNGVVEQVRRERYEQQE